MQNIRRQRVVAVLPLAFGRQQAGVREDMQMMRGVRDFRFEVLSDLGDRFGAVLQALDDLDRLEDFLLEVDVPTARQTIPLIISAVETLRQHPNIGRRSGSQLRELVISRGKTGYIALYRYNEIRDVVIVLVIRHQREVGL